MTPVLRYIEILVENRRFEHIAPLFGAPVRLGVTPLEFAEIFGISKLESMCYYMALFA